MDTLKVKATIKCDTCGCVLHRVKTIYNVTDMNAAMDTARAWRKSLIGQNCKTCQSIIDAVRG